MTMLKKEYECSSCGLLKMIETNHYGECYSLGNYNHCDSGLCSPMSVTRWLCRADIPEGVKIPVPWKIVTLGEICKIV